MPSIGTSLFFDRSRKNNTDVDCKSHPFFDGQVTADGAGMSLQLSGAMPFTNSVSRKIHQGASTNTSQSNLKKPEDCRNRDWLAM